MSRAVPLPSVRHRAAGLFAALLCALAAVTASAAPASAHAVLTGSSPAQDAVVDRLPEEVALTFSEAVSMSAGSVRVLAPDGSRADTGAEPGHDGSRRTVELKGKGPRGTYTVAWQGVSADSHPVSGAFTFSVGAPSATAPAVESGDEDGGTVAALYEAGRYVSYAGFLLLAGGAAFAAVCLRREPVPSGVRRVVTGGLVTLAAATLALLLLRGPYTASRGPAGVLDPSALGEALGTKTGVALVCRLLLLGAGALFLPALLERGTEDGPRRVPAAGGAAVGVGLAATWAVAEHASTGLQPWLAVPVDVLHLLAAAGWLGGLAALLAALRSTPSLPREAAERFSRCAAACVALLVATGLYQSWRQVGSFTALTGTDYGKLLLVKTGLVVLLAGVAAASRRWTRRLADAPDAPVEPAPVPASVPAPADEDPERAAQLARQRAAVEKTRRTRAREADPARSGLRRSVLAEAGIAAAVLAATTALTATEPARTAGAPQTPAPSAPRALAGTLRIPFDTGGPGGRGTATLRLSPGRAGENTLDLRATAPGGKPVDAPEVRLALTLPAKDLGPLSVRPEAVPGEKGRWRASGVQLPLAGDWKAALTLRTSDIDQVTETRRITVG